MNNKKIIKEFEEKIEVIINRHAPMDNCEIMENCAKAIYKEVVSQALKSQRKEIIESIDYVIEGIENTILLCDNKHTIHNLKNNVLRPLEVLIKEDE